MEKLMKNDMKVKNAQHRKTDYQEKLKRKDTGGLLGVRGLLYGQNAAIGQYSSLNGLSSHGMRLALDREKSRPLTPLLFNTSAPQSVSLNLRDAVLRGRADLVGARSGDSGSSALHKLHVPAAGGDGGCVTITGGGGVAVGGGDGGGSKGA